MRLPKAFYVSACTFFIMPFCHLDLGAQTCPSPPSCPLNNGCNRSWGGGTCGPAHGSDPECVEREPDPCKYTGDGCAPGQYPDGNCCYFVISPIILDLEGRGFDLSDPQSGVWFHVFPRIAKDFQVAWPVAGSQNGWLVLDRNGNGIIDDFGEFFGDQTSQPDPPPGQFRNGFAALAVYDRLDHGGNGDGWISKEDAIYDKLRVWVDENHDGISQPAELHTLESVGVAAISLQYELSQTTDRYGNRFRLRSIIRDATGGEADTVIYDVLLTLGGSRQDDSTTNWFIRPTKLDLK